MQTADKLKGIFPPVPTPFDTAGEIAPAKLGSNLEKLQNISVEGQQLAGFILLGSNGEYVYLDEGEKLALFQAARQAIQPDRLLVAGTGAESTRATIRLTQAAAQAGADMAIVITPAYYKPAMTGAALVAHFTAVADSSAIPIILYNMPSYTGIDITADTVLQLAKHPNIIGLKESSGNVVKIGEIAKGVKEHGLDFAILAGSASFLQAAMTVGASGGIVASANVAAELCLKIFRRMIEPSANSFSEAQHIQQQLLALNAAVTTRFGVAGLKYAMDKMHLYGGAVRAPLLPLDKAGQAALDELLKSYNVDSVTRS